MQTQCLAASRSHPIQVVSALPVIGTTRAAGRRWAATWKAAGPELERIRREELRRIDPFKTIALLCGICRPSPRLEPTWRV
jgi:hypothetical protein